MYVCESAATSKKWEGEGETKSRLKLKRDKQAFYSEGGLMVVLGVHKQRMDSIQPPYNQGPIL